LTEDGEKLGSIVKLGGSMPFKLPILLESSTRAQNPGKPGFGVAFGDA
jgi:hypothetical protein